jgi:hypothetical protein
VSTSQYELAFKYIDEFWAFMGMERKPRTTLESDDLHLHATGHSNIFDKNSCGEG